MARPTKLGLDYFPHDTHTDDDTSLQLLEAEFGLEAYAVYFKLLESIYAQGYAKQWGADDCLLFAKKIGNISVSKLSEIIKGCIRRSLFDEGVYNLSQILTSKAIQQRWLEAKRKDVSAIDPKVCLIEQTAKGISSPQKNAENPEKGVFAEKTGVIAAKTLVIAETTPESKVKYNSNKTNNNAHNARSEDDSPEPTAPKAQQEEGSAPPAAQVQVQERKNFKNIGATLRAAPSWIQSAAMKFNLTEDELKKKTEEFRLHCQLIERQHNDLQNLRNHFLNWMRKEIEHAQQQEQRTNYQNPQRYAAQTPKPDYRQRQAERDAIIKAQLQQFCGG